MPSSPNFVGPPQVDSEWGNDHGSWDIDFGNQKAEQSLIPSFQKEIPNYWSRQHFHSRSKAFLSNANLIWLSQEIKSISIPQWIEFWFALLSWSSWALCLNELGKHVGHDFSNSQVGHEISRLRFTLRTLLEEWLWLYNWTSQWCPGLATPNYWRQSSSGSCVGEEWLRHAPFSWLGKHLRLGTLKEWFPGAWLSDFSSHKQVGKVKTLP